MDTEGLDEVLSNLGLRVRNLPDKGRALFTTKSFHPGDVIIKQEPYVCVANNSVAATKTCDGCFVSSANPKKCSACHLAWYCGTTCQKLDWKLHKLECEALCRLSEEKKKSVTPSIRLLLKLCVRRNLERDKIISTSTVNNYKLVEALVSHWKDIEEKQLLLYAQIANLIYIILQWPDLDIKEVTQNLCKLACNAHTICDCELRPLGTGLYPIISVINHSCLPNAVLVFEGRSAVVRSVQFIPTNSEVSISYIETAASYITRQKALKEQYFFTCSCCHCIKSAQHEENPESEILEGYRCSDKGCSGHLHWNGDVNRFQCTKCGRVRGKEEIELLENEIKVESEKSSNFSSFKRFLERKAAISAYKRVEELQIRLYHPFSVLLLQTRDKLLKFLLEENDWREALNYCRLTIPIYERIYPEVHPILGLQYYTCGKLEWLLEETEASVKSMTNAVEILRITHGTTAPLVKGIMLALDEARAEASHKLRTSTDNA